MEKYRAKEEKRTCLRVSFGWRPTDQLEARQALAFGCQHVDHVLRVALADDCRWPQGQREHLALAVGLEHQPLRIGLSTRSARDGHAQEGRQTLVKV